MIFSNAILSGGLQYFSQVRESEMVLQLHNAVCDRFLCGQQEILHQ